MKQLSVLLLLALPLSGHSKTLMNRAIDAALALQDMSKVRQSLEKCGRGEEAECQGFVGEEAKQFAKDLGKVEKQAKSLKGEKQSDPRSTESAQRLKEAEFRLQAEAKLYEDYCTKSPSRLFCLSDEEKKKKEVQKLETTCALKREVQFYNSSSRDDVALEVILVGPVREKIETDEDCEVVLAKDKDTLKIEDTSPYVASTCQWASNDLPRKIVSVPGCNGPGKNNMLCVGHVVCRHKEDKDLKIMRVATCSVSNCGPEGAGECAQEPEFSSELPSDISETSRANKVLNSTVIKQ